jgi:hypothetical protein
MKTLTGSFPGAANGVLALTLSRFALLGSVNKPEFGVNAPLAYGIRLGSQGEVRGDRIWGNDELQPEGTHYRVQVFDYTMTRLFGPEAAMLCGPQRIDLSTVLAGFEGDATMGFNTFGISTDNVFGSPNAGIPVLIYTAFNNEVFPVNFNSPTSYGSLGAAPLAVSTYYVQVNGNQVGSVAVYPGGGFGFSTPGFSLLPGDRLVVMPPSPEDPQMSDVAITFVGIRLT